MGQGDVKYADVPGAPEWAKHKPPTSPPEDMEELLRHPPEPHSKAELYTTLFLCNLKLDDRCAEVLSRSMMRGDWKHINKITIGGNDITARGMALICGAWCNDTMPLLKNINLEENPIGCEGGKEFAKALPHLPKLETINCCECQIGDSGMVAMFHAIRDHGPKGGVGSQFYGFYLNKNQFGDAGMYAICEAMEAKAMPIIEHMDMNGSPVGDEGLLKLADCIEDGIFDHVRYMDMHWLACTKDGWEVVNDICEELKTRLHVRF